MHVKVFEELQGRVMTSVEAGRGDEEMVFTRDDGKRFKFWHLQDCCEGVAIEDIEGDVACLVGHPLTIAEERSSDELEKAADVDKNWGSDSSHTWTFYTFATIKGSVNVRWLGESNGHYSESVAFDEI